MLRHACNGMDIAYMYTNTDTCYSEVEVLALTSGGCRFSSVNVWTSFSTRIEVARSFLSSRVER